MKLLIVEVK